VRSGGPAGPETRCQYPRLSGGADGIHPASRHPGSLGRAGESRARTRCGWGALEHRRAHPWRRALQHVGYRHGPCGSFDPARGPRLRDPGVQDQFLPARDPGKAERKRPGRHPNASHCLHRGFHRRPGGPDGGPGHRHLLPHGNPSP